MGLLPNFCELENQAMQIGRGCNSVENIRDILQDVLTTLCAGGLACHTDPLEVAVAPCGTPPAQFNALFDANCTTVLNRFVIVNCEGTPGIESRLWFTADAGATWTRFLFPSGGGTSTLVQNEQHFNAVNVGGVTTVNPGPYSSFAAFNVPVVAGRNYQVVFNYRYTILTFGAVVNPVDNAYFRVLTSSQGNFEFPTSSGNVTFFYRNGADNQWVYNWTAPATGTEVFEWQSSHSGTGTGWSWDRRIVWWEYKETYLV